MAEEIIDFFFSPTSAQEILQFNSTAVKSQIVLATLISVRQCDCVAIDNRMMRWLETQC